MDEVGCWVGEPLRLNSKSASDPALSDFWFAKMWEYRLLFMSSSYPLPRISHHARLCHFKPWAQINPFSPNLLLVLVLFIDYLAYTILGRTNDFSSENGFCSFPCPPFSPITHDSAVSSDLPHSLLSAPMPQYLSSASTLFSAFVDFAHTHSH